jgi:Uma2 family endonuclease
VVGHEHASSLAHRRVSGRAPGPGRTHIEDRYEPDLAAWPLDLLDTETAWIFPGGECSFALEVTSPQQERRDYAKAAGYARAAVPVYLLVDRTRRACVVSTEPEGGRYRTRHEVPFGKAVTLPLAPPVTLETADF